MKRVLAAVALSAGALTGLSAGAAQAECVEGADLAEICVAEERLSERGYWYTLVGVSVAYTNVFDVSKGNVDGREYWEAGGLIEVGQARQDQYPHQTSAPLVTQHSDPCLIKVYVPTDGSVVSQACPQAAVIPYINPIPSL